MERSCAQAVKLGLPSIAFTEHAEFGSWNIGPDDVPRLIHTMGLHASPDNVVVPPALDVSGYLGELERCRRLFPDLRILSGVEMSEPHWYSEEAARLSRTTGFDRILGSAHSIRPAEGTRFVSSYFRSWPAQRVVQTYLEQVLQMVEESTVFAILAHIDFPIRYWPAQAGPYDPATFEEEYRTVLRALAQSGRALEVNTRIPLHTEIVRWWHEVGGDAVTFGSDAHVPGNVGAGFAQAAAMVEAHGFRCGHDRHDFWGRSLTR